jgi:protein-S-isoprenylcysteine O-methyltransferase Ste14
MVWLDPTAASFLVGLAVVAAGEFARLWGVAIAGSETRTTGPVGGTFLITKGPFAYVRNPLYVGNMLMYSGVGIMANLPWLALIALAYFMFQYSLIVSLEEEYLRRTYGKAFDAYCRAVPRFVPALTPYDSGTHEQPVLDWKRGVMSEKRTLQAVAAITAVILLIGALRG